MFWIFIPTLAAAGFFSDHIERYLNTSVEPCDDFYDHVCSAAVTDGHFLTKKRTENFEKVLDQLALPRIREFRLRVTEEIEKHPTELTDEGDSEGSGEVGEAFEECRFEEGNAVDFLKGMEMYDAFYRLQSTPHYNTLKKKISDVFQVLKDILIEEFSAAPWTKKRPDLVEFMKTVTLGQLETKDFEIGIEMYIINSRYEECIRSTPKLSSPFVKRCLSYAVCPFAYKFTKYVKNDELLKELWRRNGFTDQGLYFGDRNAIILSPMYFTMEEEDLPFMLGAIDLTIAHELGHVFFNPQIGALPSNSECFRHHMYKSCRSYINDDFECFDYNTTSCIGAWVPGYYCRFADDAADWIGMHAGIKALRTYFPKIFPQDSLEDCPDPKSIEIMKQFFFATAVDWCRPNSMTGNPNHSPPKLRVNAINSLFSEFSEAFNCKRGSRMAKGATCLPFAGIGAPTRKNRSNKRNLQ